MHLHDIVQAIKGVRRRPFLAHIPPTISVPDDIPTTRFPSGFQHYLHSHSRHNIIAQLSQRLILGLMPLTIDWLMTELRSLICLSDPDEYLLRRHESTKKYLTTLQECRSKLYQQLETITKQEYPLIDLDQTWNHDIIESSPQGVCGSVLIHVITSTNPKKDVPTYLFELFCLVAIGNVDYIIIVFPLQGMIMKISTRLWLIRETFRTMLVEKVQHLMQENQ
jgi:hypothetical protein